MKALLFALGIACLAGTAHAQNYPTKPVKLIVPAGPGSAPDLRARQIAANFALGQSLVIENRPGGSSIIAAEAAARAQGDGYTLLLGNIITHALNPWLFKSLPYRAEEDFVPVTMISAGPYILAIHPQIPARNLAELVAYVKTKPGQLAFASSGRGTNSHLIMEQLKATTGIDVVHVPYKATGAEIPDLMAGNIAMGFNFWSILKPHVNSGRLRVIAVASKRRLAVAPDLPTFAEAGVPGIEASGWQGIFAPAGTPQAIVVKLHAEFARILNLAEIRNQIIDTGAEPGGSSPEEFGAFVRAERARWGNAIAEAKIPAE